MTPHPRDVAAFRRVVADRLGLAFADAQVATLAEVLARRVTASDAPVATYLERLRGALDVRELAALAGELTVGETYFFRDPDQLRAFREVVVPESARRSGGRLRILCAGCASGEEPYSLAMLLREHHGDDFRIRAVDVNAAALARAERMRYSAWSLREIPPDKRSAWFRREGNEHVLRHEIAAGVTFEERNLADLDASLFAPSAYDVVFCRNVLMYFTPDAARAVVAAIARSLVPGGHLFLGHAENLRGISTEYHLLHTHGTFYYQRRGGRESPVHPPLPSVDEPPAPLASESWVDVIHDATQRVRALSAAAVAAAEPPPAARSDLGPAIRLLHDERFADAAELLRELPAAAAHDPDVMLLRSVLQTQTGDLGGAERTCEELLRVDEMSAGAHYLLALCREAAGDVRAALEHDRVASYLDASFAMPVLHLGLLARRDGDASLALAAFGRAIVLLEREDASRILLFGGGFGRDALLALCRTELAKSGRA